MEDLQSREATGVVLENQHGIVRVELDEVCAGGSCAGCGHACGTDGHRVVTLADSDATADLAAGDRVALRRPMSSTAAALRLLCLPLAAFVIAGYLCSAVAGFSEGIAALAALAVSALVYVAINRIWSDSGRWQFLHRI